MLDLSRQHREYMNELVAATQRVLAHGQFILGAEVAEFETALGAYEQGAHVVGVSSGTDALLVALMALDVGPEHEVVVPAFSFFATAGVVHRMGAKPVFVDIRPDTYNATAQDLLDAVSLNTRALMPVYLFGQMSDISSLKQQISSFAVIEDAAQALGARQAGKGLAHDADVAATSFFPTKNLGGMGDGGAVITFDSSLYERLKMLRVHGAKPKYTHHVVGGNFRLDAMQAALLSVKLRFLRQQIVVRQSLASRYDELFNASGLVERGLVSTPVRQPNSEHTFNQYVIRVQRRDEVRSFLADHGVASMVYYPSPLHLQPCFAHLGHGPGDFPHAELACKEVLALPCFPGLTTDEQSMVVHQIAYFYGC